MAHPQVELYGSDRMFLQAVRAFLEAGDDVTVTTPGTGPLIEELNACGADVVLCPTPVLRRSALRPRGLLGLMTLTARSTRPMWKLLRRARPDVVYVSTIAAPWWTILSRLTGHKVVVHVHEALVAVPLVIRVALLAPLNAAHRIVVNSDATARVTARDFRWLIRRTTRIYNGVEIPSRQRPAGQGAHTPLRLVLVGRLSMVKGTDIAVDAVAELTRRGRDVTLELVGDVFTGYEWFERQLHANVERHALEDRVNFAGFREDGWTAFTTADIALVPSRNESLGNTSIEAQLCGIPVVVSDREGLPETVGQGRRGTIVPAEDPQAIADAVQLIADDWPTALERAEDARSECADIFSVRAFHGQLRRTVHDIGEATRDITS